MLSIEQQIGQLFFIGIPGPELDQTTNELLETVQPGGVCLFARNIRERQQTRDLLDGLRGALRPLLSIDQEGGLVDRLRRVMTPMPSANRIRSEGDASELGSIVGETLRLLGFNMDFAPVVDVIDEARSQYSNGLHSRAFGDSPTEVTALASAFLTSLQRSGIVGCLKHFPGIGASEVDSHAHLPEVGVPEADIRDKDLVPYASLLTRGDVHCVMVAHAAYPNLSLQDVDQSGKLLPSSLSPSIISNLLRGELGYGGLVVTDDLEMGAIVENYGMGDACRMAIAAGADMLAICNSSDAVIEGFESVRRAVGSGEISKDRIAQSVARISSLKGSVSEPLTFDHSRLDALSERIAELDSRLK